MPLRKRSSTRALTDASLQLTAGRRGRAGVMLFLVAILLAAGGYYGFRHLEVRFAALADMAAVQADNTRLRGELDAVRVELEMERATHAELRRQVAELNERVSQLNNELGFFNSQTKGGKKPN